MLFKHRDTVGDVQLRDTIEDALLQLQALHHTHREATRLFLMARRQGSTEVNYRGKPPASHGSCLSSRQARWQGS